MFFWFLFFLFISLPPYQCFPVSSPEWATCTHMLMSGLGWVPVGNRPEIKLSQALVGWCTESSACSHWGLVMGGDVTGLQKPGGCSAVGGLGMVWASASGSMKMMLISQRTIAGVPCGPGTDPESTSHTVCTPKASQVFKNQGHEGHPSREGARGHHPPGP